MLRFLPPEQLKAITDLELGAEPSSSSSDAAFADALAHIDAAVEHSLQSSHPAYFNQLWGGVDALSLGGAWTTEALNTSQFTYEVAPFFSLAEEEVLRYSRQQLVGWPHGDGLFCSGW